MTEARHIKTPLTDEVVKSLTAGDQVLISGTVYTARDQAHKRLCKAIELGQELPVDLNGQVLYFVGPTPPAENRVIGAAGPTTSSRMDPFSPMLIKAGLKGMIGKGYRGQEVQHMLQQYNAVHFAATGGAGALLSNCIVEAEVIAYEDLGTEAIRKLKFENFPAYVAYDSKGNSIYQGECE